MNMVINLPSSIGHMLMNRDQQNGKRTNWYSEYLQL